MKKIALVLPLTLFSCSDVEPVYPFAEDENAEIAAKECGVDDWHWVPEGQIIVFDGPQSNEPVFRYEIETLANEEIESDEERSWDRTQRIETINTCLEASFDKQRVNASVSAPGLVLTVVGTTDTKGDAK